MRATRKEVAQYLRKRSILDLKNEDMAQIAGLCQAMGQSGRGTREELIKRLGVAIWNKEYDNGR